MYITHTCVCIYIYIYIYICYMCPWQRSGKTSEASGHTAGTTLRPIRKVRIRKLRIAGSEFPGNTR